MAVTRHFTESGFHRICWGNRCVTVEDKLPEDVPEKDRREMVESLASHLSLLPSFFVNPLFRPVGREGAVRFRFELKERGACSFVSGLYAIGDNVVRLVLRDSNDRPSRHVLFHELGGHVFSDFEVADDNLADLTASPRFPFRSYYRWKLARLFSDEEIRIYEQLLLLERETACKPELEEERKTIQGFLKPFRDRVLTRFVSVYAAEGSGLRNEWNIPYEDFAEVMGLFLENLTGDRDDLEAMRKKEPLLRLVELRYRAERDGLEVIEGVRKEELFTRKGFRKILGIDLPAEPETGWIGRLFSIPIIGGIRFFFHSHIRTSSKNRQPYLFGER